MAKRTSKEIIEQVGFLRGERGTWESHWQDLADFILPRKDDITKTRFPGEKVTQFLPKGP